MNELILSKLPVSNDYKRILIKYWTENMMKQIHPKVKEPICQFRDLNCSNDKERTAGTTQKSLIKLDNKFILKCLDNENYFELIKVMFHEITHTY